MWLWSPTVFGAALEMDVTRVSTVTRRSWNVSSSPSSSTSLSFRSTSSAARLRFRPLFRCKTAVPSHSSSESSTTKWGDTSESDATSTSCLFPIKSIIIPSILNVVTSSLTETPVLTQKMRTLVSTGRLYLLSRSRSAIPANLSTTIASYEMSYALLLTSSVTGSCTAPVQLCSLSSQKSMELLSVNHRDNSCKRRREVRRA